VISLVALLNHVVPSQQNYHVANPIYLSMYVSGTASTVIC